MYTTWCSVLTVVSYLYSSTVQV